jgi:hypothetical protein
MLGWSAPQPITKSVPNPPANPTNAGSKSQAAVRANRQCKNRLEDDSAVAGTLVRINKRLGWHRWQSWRMFLHFHPLYPLHI